MLLHQRFNDQILEDGTVVEFGPELPQRITSIHQHLDNTNLIEQLYYIAIEGKDMILEAVERTHTKRLVEFERE